MIVFHIKGQELSVAQPTIVSDTIDYLTARFVFKTSEWDGLQKWAHFAKDSISYDILLSDDEIKKNQHLNLSDGTWNVYLHGMAVEDGDVVERITTEIVKVSVKKSGVLNGLPLPDVPASAAEQIFAAAQEAINVANSVRDDADSGAFDGQDGRDGIDGKDGVDGEDAKINGYNTVNIVAGENVEIEQSDNTLTISSTGGGGGTSDHRQLSNRDAANQHPISAISGLADALSGKQDAIADLATIRSGASLGATAVQPEAGKGLFSGSYDDLTDKPTIPPAVTDAHINSLIDAKLGDLESAVTMLEGVV